MASSRRFYERQVETRRAMDEQVKKIGSWISESSRQIDNAGRDQRVDYMRRERIRKEVEEEAAMEAKLAEVERRKREIEERRLVEDKLDRKLREEEDANVADKRLRQKVREGSYELRELREKLNAAYVAREREAQIAERALAVEQAKVADRELDVQNDAILSKQFSGHDEEESHKRALETEAAQRLMEDERLQRKKLREEKEREKAEDKKLVQAVVQKIQDEESSAEQKRAQRTNAMRQDMEEDFKQLELKKHALDYEEAEYARKAKEYNELQEARVDADAQAKKSAAADRDAIYGVIARDIAEKDKTREELEDLRIELAYEEERLKAMRMEQELAERRAREKAESLAAREYSLELQRKRLEAEAEEEARYRAAMVKKFAAQEAEDRAQAEDVQVRARAFAASVMVMEKERRERRDKLLREQAEASQVDATRDIEIQKIVEEERAALILEHAARLGARLPGAVLRGDADIDLLPEEVREAFLPQPDDVSKDTQSSRGRYAEKVDSLKRRADTLEAERRQKVRQTVGHHRSTGVAAALQWDEREQLALQRSRGEGLPF